MKKTCKIVLLTAAVAGLVLVAAALIAPPLAKRYIEKHDRELLGRSIRIERLRFNLFTGRLRVEQLRIGGVEDSATFFRLDSFDMRMRLWPLLARRIDVRRLHFTAPDLKLYQRGSAFNFDDILARFASDTTAVETPAEPAEPWEVAIRDILIRRGHIFYKDLALGATWGLNDVDLTIPDVYFSGAKTDVGAVLNFAEGGSLATKVGYDIASSAFDIGLRLEAFDLAATLPYFRQWLDVGSVGGRLWAEVRLRGDAEHLLSMRAEGTAALAGLALRDPAQRTVARIDTLGMKLTEGDLGRMRFRFERVYASGFSALVELTPEGNNLTALLRPASGTEGAEGSEGTKGTEGTESTEDTEGSVADASKAPAAASDDSATGSASASATAETASGPVPSLQIADLEIDRGQVELRDLTLASPFTYRISEIRMRSRDFDPAARNRLTVDARMQQTGKARLGWDGSLDDIANQSITLWLTNVALKDFSPYSEHFTAYPLTQGNLTFRSQNVIRNRYLDGTNHLDVFEPEVAKKRKDIQPEMHIPLKLGLYVLKDKKGHVKMDLPVRGSLDSPEFSYRKIVLKAIGNVLLKVVTAPFSFLGGHRDNLEYISLDASQYAFTSEQYAAFDKIAAMLQDKPEMHITLTQHIALERALPAQAAAALRMAYADHRRAAADSMATTDTAADSTASVSTPADSAATAGAPARRAPMTLLEYEKIQQTDIRTAEIAAFADSLLALRGIRAAGLSPAGKAVALYRDKALGQLRNLMRVRDHVLGEYMRSTHGLTAPAFALQTPDSATLAAYKGRDRYTIALELDGESLQIVPADSTAGNEALSGAAFGAAGAMDSAAGAAMDSAAGAAMDSAAGAAVGSASGTAAGSAPETTVPGEAIPAAEAFNNGTIPSAEPPTVPEKNTEAIPTAAPSTAPEAKASAGD